MVKPRFQLDDVKAKAQGLWADTIFPRFNIDVRFKKKTPCPACGGRDRFRYEMVITFANTVAQVMASVLSKNAHIYRFQTRLQKLQPLSDLMQRQISQMQTVKNGVKKKNYVIKNSVNLSASFRRILHVKQKAFSAMLIWVISAFI